MIDKLCPPCETPSDFVPVPIDETLCPVPEVVERPSLLPTETQIEVVTDTFEDALRKVLRTYNCETVPGKPEYVPPMVFGIPPFGVATVPYQFKFIAMHGRPPYTFRVLNGSIPSGLVLDHNSGMIAGTPQFEENSVFTIEVRDSENRTNQLMSSISILPG